MGNKMGKDRQSFWCWLGVVCLLAASAAASAAPPPIKAVLLYGGKPNAKMFDAIRAAIVTLNPALAERLVLQMEAAEPLAGKFEPVAARLMAQKPDLAIALDMESAVALSKARGNGTTPIVFRGHSDPLGAKLIASYARPGRNLTGITTYRCLDDKLVELLLDAFPSAQRIGFFIEPGIEDYGCHKRAQEFARTRGITLVDVHLASPKDVQPTMETLGRHKFDAMVVPALTPTWTQRKHIIAALDTLGVPAIYEAQVFTDSGGLMYFGAINQDDISTRLAELIVKVLSGENAGDIPVAQPTRFELVINLKAANAQRYGISPRLLRRADRIIE